MTDLSAAEQAYLQLENKIVLLELNPGQLYSEKELVEIVGIGRTPVREALQRLQIEGLVNIQQRRGIQITQVDANEQLALLQMRRPMQNFVVEHAALHAIDADREQLGQLAEKLVQAGSQGVPNKAMALDLVREAHELMLRACHNEFAIKTMRIVQGVSRRFWVYHLKPTDFNEAAQLHGQLLQSIAAGSTSKALNYSNLLIDYLETFAKRTTSWQ